MPIQDPDPSESTEQGESGTGWGAGSPGRELVPSSSGKIGRFSPAVGKVGVYSGMNLKNIKYELS